jgi:uncharacterized membrane protein
MASETGRIEAFSDGIFGIAATLLILEIKIPPAGQDLAQSLLHQWPSYFAFALSFAFIGIMWMNHHRLFTFIRKADDGLLAVNLLLLLGITFVPFPTSVLAAHLATANERTAAILYNGTYLAVGIFFNLLWHHAVRRKLLGHEISPEAIHRMTRRFAVGPTAYVPLFLLSWSNPRISIFLNAMLAVYFALPTSRPPKSGHEVSGH